jgi:HAD superfamily hydrolase (TIGR01509 family)
MITDIDAVLFDMDGTLVDSEHMTRLEVDGWLAERGFDGSTVPDERLHGVTWDQIAADLQEQFGVPCTGSELDARCEHLWATSPPEPMPGVIDALRACKKAGLKLSIATSANRATAEVLAARDGFSGIFDAIVTADDIQRSKPDPQIFEVAAARLGVDPARCLVFEDSLAGLRAAKAAGMTAIAILLRCAHPPTARAIADRSIIDFTELEPGFFEGLRSLA